jgi:hypothetical protein
MAGPIVSAALPIVGQAVSNLFQPAVSGIKGRIGAAAATSEGTGNSAEEILNYQKQFGVTPEQASAIASHIQDRERNAATAQQQGNVYQGAALANRAANLNTQRQAVVDAQAQQAALAGQLVNTVQAARDSAANAVNSGFQTAAAMFR